MGDSDHEEVPEQVPRPAAVVQTMPRPMPRIDPPSELVLDHDREANFRVFKARWTSFAVLSRLDSESQAYQKEFLLYAAGSEASKVVEASARYSADMTCETVLQVLEQFCIGERNTIHERYKFNTRTQLPGESFDSFYAELRTLAGRCRYD